MTNTRPQAGDIVASFAEHLSLPPKFVRQVIADLKAHDRIESGRPVHPEVTPVAIVRILLALTSNTIRDAVKTGRALGALALTDGVGQPTLEVQLTDIVEEAVGRRYGETDFRDGLIVVARNETFAVAGLGTYSARAEQTGLSRYMVIKVKSLYRIASDLIAGAA